MGTTLITGLGLVGTSYAQNALKRGENVVAVYVAPEKPGTKIDPLKEAAVAAKLPHLAAKRACAAQNVGKPFLIGKEGIVPV